MTGSTWRAESSPDTYEGDASDWVTWAQAAEIVGCPVPTVDWYQRQGRITKRTERPTLERASVEEFAVWWRQRQEGRQRARKRTRPEPDPAEWATAKEAAELLGVSAGHLGYLSPQGHLVDLVEGGRRWIRRDSPRAVMSERDKWVSYTTAAQIVGCRRSTIGTAVKHGRIEGRQVDQQQASLRRGSVEAFAGEWRAEQQRAEERRAKRKPHQPPDDEHVWLSPTEAALVMGLSRNGVRYRAERGLLPAVRKGRWMWFRREHVEQAAAARVLASRLEQ